MNKKFGVTPQTIARLEKLQDILKNESNMVLSKEEVISLAIMRFLHEKTREVD